ncbi:hypothetical protein [Azoarcus sp. DN11]|uniref:hypothetical protein n=1 Tax=Azoarcus sp. DN11 TaxID=356837 RepID=UPI000EB13A2E|nr:hypothetical protein [Azoarcus sp. DN11]AYH41914.1 hypothetical protein CDA09_00695 [Azoarcus sp. DN11]
MPTVKYVDEAKSYGLAQGYPYSIDQELFKDLPDIRPRGLPPLHPAFLCEGVRQFRGQQS